MALPPRLLLSWYGEPGQAAPPLRAGERWALLVRLKRPHGLMNPHAFDYELWLFEQNLRATGVVRPGSMQRLAAASPWSLNAWRQDLREALQRRVSDPGRAGVLAALSLGDQAAISRADWALFRDTGVAHLLSVSGLHVTMFAWLVQGLTGWLWRRSARLCLAWPAPRAALWAGVVAALAYALFSGWGVPAQRTVWMLTSLAVLRSLGLQWPWPLALLLAAVVVTAIDPWAISQAGFWLSFVAVGLLMASDAQWAEPRSVKNLLLRRPAQPMGGHAGPGAAESAVLSADLHGRPAGQSAGHSAGQLSHHAAGPGRRAAAGAVGLGRMAAAQALMAYLRLLDGLPWPSGAAGRAAVGADRRAGGRGLLLVMPLPWRLRGLRPGPAGTAAVARAARPPVG